MNNEKLIIKLSDAIKAGKTKGNILQIPIFETIQEIDGELYGIIKGFIAPPHSKQDGKPLIH
ncbi:hypothetical protein G4Z05_00655 [Bacillus thermocopriae]|uniref:Uncharacterized protein n=1 Tax=Neobacillus thermocopriae TaxID=1215031 RepID=A0A6B3TMH3_9BACI|nr:hypothetical protein [Neobacillus thermocopriae]NEX77411.1 hypothetical protein [Neobacillus thermocopriae]